MFQPAQAEVSAHPECAGIPQLKGKRMYELSQRDMQNLLNRFVSITNIPEPPQGTVAHSPTGLRLGGSPGVYTSKNASLSK